MCSPTMPWSPSYNEPEARAAIAGAGTWRAILHALGLGYRGKNINTLRRWARKWGIPTDHLPDRRGPRPNYGDADLRNLRIICPNCAATLDTHCGRKNREPLSPLACL